MKSFEVSNKTLLGILFILLLLLKLLSGKAQPGQHLSSSASPYAATTHLCAECSTGRTIAAGNLTAEFNYLSSLAPSYHFIYTGSRLVLMQGFPSRGSQPRAMWISFKPDFLY